MAATLAYALLLSALAGTSSQRLSVRQLRAASRRVPVPTTRVAARRPVSCDANLRVSRRGMGRQMAGTLLGLSAVGLSLGTAGTARAERTDIPDCYPSCVKVGVREMQIVFSLFFCITLTTSSNMPRCFRDKK